MLVTVVMDLGIGNAYAAKGPNRESHPVVVGSPGITAFCVEIGTSKLVPGRESASTRLSLNIFPRSLPVMFSSAIASKTKALLLYAGVEADGKTAGSFVIMLFRYSVHIVSVALTMKRCYLRSRVQGMNVKLGVK